MTDAEERKRRRRRRRRERGERSLLALLPHLLTTGNLAAGFYAIVASSTGAPDAFDRAGLAIVIAGVFDMLDGRVARRIGSTSRFGVEYDSISDTVSFGIAPAVLAFHAGTFQELGWTGWVMAFLYTACAALRLARFNVSPGRFRGRFEGLPSPAAAGMVLATVWFTSFLRESGVVLGLPASLPALGVAMLGLLMVSPVPYRSFKELRFRASYTNVVLATLVLLLVLSKPSVTFFLVGLAYVSSGPLEILWRWRTGQTLEEIVQGDAPEGEDSTQGTQS